MYHLMVVAQQLRFCACDREVKRSNLRTTREPLLGLLLVLLEHLWQNWFVVKVLLHNRYAKSSFFFTSVSCFCSSQSHPKSTPELQNASNLWMMLNFDKGVKFRNNTFDVTLLQLIPPAVRVWTTGLHHCMIPTAGGFLMIYSPT